MISEKSIGTSLGIQKYNSWDHDQMTLIRAFLRLQMEKKSKIVF